MGMNKEKPNSFEEMAKEIETKETVEESTTDKDVEETTEKATEEVADNSETEIPA